MSATPDSSASPATPIREVLGKLAAGEGLAASEAEGFFEELLAGRLEEAQIGSALGTMQVRGVCVDALVGGATAMRRHVTRIPGAEARPGRLIDTCGTGGAPKTFNVSTLAAIVAASAAPGRVFVAKHGNRSRTGRGSAEVLAGLGVNVDASPIVQGRCLLEAGVCFCFAIHHHPATRHAAGARRALGFPTIFNLLGPLTNPAGARRQLIGVYRADLVEPMAAALARLGAERAMVVHGLDGLDELTTTGASVVATVDGGVVRASRFEPEKLGVRIVKQSELLASDLSDAVRIAREMLGGKPGAAAEIVALNAAAALVVAGEFGGLAEGLEAARRALASGAAERTLAAMARLSHTSDGT